LAKKAMDDLLKRRMSATQQASELQASDEAYEKLFREAPPAVNARICEIPLDKLTPFFTADIGFRPYTRSQLEAFAEQLKEEGLMVRIIVRPIADCGRYEILAGHNRTNAARLAGWVEIPAEIVEADDARAIVIATSTNLIQRQNLSVIERGKAYRALLEAKNRNGQKNAARETFGDSRQRYNARTLVAEFFGVTEYEIRKAIKLTQLIPELADILENKPKQLNLACAELIADYDAESQRAFIEMCTIEGNSINKATVRHIVSRCPPPTAAKQAMFNAWHESQAAADAKRTTKPKKISFDRKRFAPYLDKLGSDRELEELFLEFLRKRTGA
jgi:ParB family chromosome partitioning protein